LTSDGKIKTCLFSQEEIDIKTPLRNGATQNEIVSIFAQAVANKPSGHHLNAKDHQNACQQAMRAIGG
jgi:cyclic pyranopterin phosphate synthase